MRDKVMMGMIVGATLIVTGCPIYHYYILPVMRIHGFKK
jgi:hypothetical protein